MPTASLTADSLAKHLKRCGYSDALLARDYDYGAGRVPLAAFADSPHDARSVCIGAVDSPGDSTGEIARIKPLGSPVVFACHSGQLQWWKQTAGEPEHIESVKVSHLRGFFDTHKRDFSPKVIFEGKTRKRLPGQTQLTFVDAGLMPVLEKQTGESLSQMVVLVIRGIEQSLNKPIRSKRDIEAVFKSAFWLLGAKVLRDKRVPSFKTLRLSDIDDVFRRVGQHYGDTDGLPPGGKAWRRAIEQAAETIGAYRSLAHVSTESLAYLYENALIPANVRKALGIHSTPSALVDYMVWQLWPWIEEMSENRRHVFEPACGHGAFLVGAMRMLRQWTNIRDGQKRHAYLRDHLHGVEIDPFALEIAKLSLTLADIPHGNRWDLKQNDMFSGSVLEKGATTCGVLLANPPYERFTLDDRKHYRKARVTIKANTKACEMLLRTIPHLNPGACFGVVVPQGLLHSKEAIDLRKGILRDFEISEIGVFADNLFERADHETAVMLGRRKVRKRASTAMWFRRVREAGVGAFRDRFAFSSEEHVDMSRFVASPSSDLRVPELDVVWRYLGGYPTLSSIAVAGQGFSFHGKNLPNGMETLSSRAKSGYVPCFTSSRGSPPIYGVPERKWMNTNLAVIQSARMGLSGHPGQVLVNHARTSRSSWTVQAWLDQEGIAVKGNFLVVRAEEAGIPGLLLWAILNSPVINGYIYCRAMKVHVSGFDLLNVPIPRVKLDWSSPIIAAAQTYLSTVKATDGFFQSDPPSSEEVRSSLLALDAAVLRAYDLPPRLERQLLDLFTGVERKGVGCDFRGYYPRGFTSYLPLHVLLSDRFERAAADHASERFGASTSGYVGEVLAMAATELDTE